MTQPMTHIDPDWFPTSRVEMADMVRHVNHLAEELDRLRREAREEES